MYFKRIDILLLLIGNYFFIKLLDWFSGKGFMDYMDFC